MDKKYITLNLAGEKYDYVYYPKSREVCTQEFPDVPVVRVFLGCGHSLTHKVLVNIVEDKLKEYQMLEDCF